MPTPSMWPFPREISSGYIKDLSTADTRIRGDSRHWENTDARCSLPASPRPPRQPHLICYTVGIPSLQRPRAPSAWSPQSARTPMLGWYAVVGHAMCEEVVAYCDTLIVAHSSRFSGVVCSLLRACLPSIAAFNTKLHSQD